MHQSILKVYERLPRSPLSVTFYDMDSPIESVRKRYQITVIHKHISEHEAAMKTAAIISGASRLLRPQSIVEPVDGEGGIVCGQ